MSRPSRKFQHLDVRNEYTGVPRSRTPLGLQSPYRVDRSNGGGGVAAARTPKHHRSTRSYRHANHSSTSRMSRSTARLPRISSRGSSGVNSPQNSRQHSKSVSRLPNVSRRTNGNNGIDGGDGAFEIEKQNRVNKVMERFLRDDQYSTIRRLIAANPHMSGYDLKGAIEYGLKTMPVSHLAPTEESRSLHARNARGAPENVLENLNSEYRLLEQSKKMFAQQQQPAANTEQNRDEDDENNEGGDRATNVCLASSLCSLIGDNTANNNSNAMTDDNDNTVEASLNVDDWDVSPFLKKAFQSQTSLDVSMTPKPHILTASYQDFEYGKTTDLPIGHKEMAQLVDDVTNFVDMSPLEAVPFEAAIFRDAEPKPALYRVQQKYSDIVADVMMDMTPCDRSSVVLNNFRPVEEDAMEQEIRNEAAKFTERRSATVSVNMDGQQDVSLWDQRLVPMKRPPPITLAPLDSEQREDSPTQSEQGDEPPIENTLDTVMEDIEYAQPRKTTTTTTTTSSSSRSHTTTAATIDPKQTANMILQALADALSNQTDDNNPTAKKVMKLLSPSAASEPSQFTTLNSFEPTVDEVLSATSSEVVSVTKNRPEILVRGRMERIDQVVALLDNGTSVHTADYHGNQLIHVACQIGSKRLARTALKYGANINAQNNQGQTPLHFLYAYNYDKLAEYLLSKGADANLQNVWGMVPSQGLRDGGTQEHYYENSQSRYSQHYPGNIQ